MTSKAPAMHVAKVISKKAGKTYRSTLIRTSYRDHDGRSQKKTLGKISHLPEPLIAIIDHYCKGHQLIDANEAFEIVATRKHGAVEAVCSAFDQLCFHNLISSQSPRPRELILALVAARIIRPHTKLATTRWWKDTTLDDYFDIAGADADDVYAAMDWLITRQGVIEGKLIRRHLKPGAMALFDLSSTYLEGTRCPLAQFGYNRDGRKGKLQVNFGLLCDLDGRPLGVSVYPGSVRDSTTLIAQVNKLRQRYGIERLVVVGDRGMVTQVNIDALRKLDGLHWISALKSRAVRKLVRKGALSAARFDEVNLFEVLHPDFPQERLVACRNAALARRRAATREALLVATGEKLEAIQTRVSKGRLSGRAEIGLSVGEVINARRVKKHFIVDITERSLDFRRNQASIAEEAFLDGIYVIRTSLDADSMNAADCVRHYKRLTRVERAFRTIKTVNLKVRPVHHRTEERVRTHIFLCMLAYYVEWHMREAWRGILFSDPEPEAIDSGRDPVPGAVRSDAAKRKAATGTLDDGSKVHCFRTLIEHLETITRNTCRNKLLRDVSFELTTLATDGQQQALDLIKTIRF